LDGIIFGNERFLVIGGPPKAPVMLTSTDGVGWSQYAIASFLEGIYYVNGQFMMGNYDGFGSGRYSLQTSSDGLNWTSWYGLPLDAWRSGISGLAYGNGHVVVVGANGVILQSGLFVRLSMVPAPVSGWRLLSLEAAAGLSYAIQSSTDLISWQ